MHKKIKLSVGAWANLIAILTLIITISINAKALIDQNKIASADFTLRLSQDLENSKYQEAKNLIYESNQSTQVVYTETNKNGINEADLYDYLNKLETIGGLMDEKIINKDLAYSEFSYDFVKSWCNTNIKESIEKIRKTDGSKKIEYIYFHSLESFAGYVMKKENKKCPDYDNI